MSSPLALHVYHASWPDAFARESVQLEAALGDRLVAIAHVGSTAVPGLAARPIIDVALEVTEPYTCVATLLGMGYEADPVARGLARGDDPDALDPGFCLFLVPTPEDWRQYLYFRDHLRETPRLALHYQALKGVLAARCGGDRRAYMEAKAAFITSVVSP